MKNSKKDKIVITYGTFDLLHYGHINILKRAKKYGNKLYVGVSTDDFNKLKGKSSHQSYKERVENLKLIKIVDLVFPEKTWTQKKNDIKKYNANVFVMGSDWEGKFDEYATDNCQVVYLPRTEGISSTKLRELKNKK